MKKVLFIFALLLSGLTAGAQDDVYGHRDEAVDEHQNDGGFTGAGITADGAYERKEVVMVDTVSAGVLYDRAMMALSDWTGANGKAKVGVDYQNQETHTVIYKGRYSLGFKDVFLGTGWERFADFTLKVKCKDGRAQVTLSVPTVTGVYNANGITRRATIGQLAQTVEKSRGKKRERGLEMMRYLTGTADEIVVAIEESLKGEESEEDF